jgi:chemotaxis signal transduction protein
LGLFNLRGDVVPLFDTAALADAGSLAKWTHAVVVETAAGIAALAAGGVPETLVLDEPVAPSESPWIEATYAIGRSLIPLLDTGALLGLEPTAACPFAVVVQTAHGPAGLAVTGLPVLDMNEDRGRAQAAVLDRGRELVERGADVLVLGCMSMAFLGVAEQLSEELGVPVINPARTALKSAELLIGSGLTHSRRAFPVPPKLAVA